MTHRDLIESIEGIRTEQKWRGLPIDVLEDKFIKPFLDLSEDEVVAVVTTLSAKSYDMFRKKLWTAQDVPEEENGYDRTIDIMTALKRLLLFRLPVAVNPSERTSLTQQLAHASLILNPVLIAGRIGQRADDDDDDEPDGSDESDGV